jgi:hypothetical protein
MATITLEIKWTRQDCGEWMRAVSSVQLPKGFTIGMSARCDGYWFLHMEHKAMGILLYSDCKNIGEIDGDEPIHPNALTPEERLRLAMAAAEEQVAELMGGVVT